MPVKHKRRSRNKAAKQSFPKTKSPVERGSRSNHPHQSTKARPSKITDSKQILHHEPFPDLDYDSYEIEDFDGLIRLVTFHVGKMKGYCSFLLPPLNRAFLKSASGIKDRVRFARSALYRFLNFDTASARSTWEIRELGFNIARNLHWAIGDNVRRMLQSEGRLRASEAKKIKALLSDAVDQLAVGESCKQPANKEVVEIHNNGFMADQTRFPAPKGWANLGELPLPTELPIACIAIECARQLVAELHRLPTKKEVKNAVIKFYPEVKSSRSVKKTETLSEAMWSKVWKEAGLNTLKRDCNW